MPSRSMEYTRSYDPGGMYRSSGLDPKGSSHGNRYNQGHPGDWAYPHVDHRGGGTNERPPYSRQESFGSMDQSHLYENRQSVYLGGGPGPSSSGGSPRPMRETTQHEDHYQPRLPVRTTSFEKETSICNNNSGHLYGGHDSFGSVASPAWVDQKYSKGSSSHHHHHHDAYYDVSSGDDLSKSSSHHRPYQLNQRYNHHAPSSASFDRKAPVPSKSYSRQEAMERKMQEAGQGGGRSSSSSQGRSSNSRPNVIEVAPGLFLRLRGADETWNAVERDFYVPCHCFGCDTMIFCIQDADYVICPICKVISPVDMSGQEGSTSAEDPGKEGGVGLGFSIEDLTQFQEDIFYRRERHNNYHQHRPMEEVLLPPPDREHWQRKSSYK